MFGFVKKKDYDAVMESYQRASRELQGTLMVLKDMEKDIDLEYKRAEYWKAKALHPDVEPYVEGNKKTIKYIKS